MYASHTNPGREPFGGYLNESVFALCREEEVRFKGRQAGDALLQASASVFVGDGIAKYVAIGDRQ